MALKGGQADNVIDDAIEGGIEAILQQHPRFKDNQDYILGHIDRKRLKEGIGRLEAGIYEEEKRSKKQFSDEEKKALLYHGLANYVASGGAFDDIGKEVILKNSLEEKAKRGWFSGLWARRILEGEKYLDKVLDAFKNLYALLKSGDYAQRMPEVAQAVTTVYDMGFLDSAVDVLKQYSLIDGRKYEMLKHSIHEKAKAYVKETEKGVEKYTQHKVAATIFGIIGIFIILISGAGVTGAVIGGIKGNIIGALLGTTLLCVSGLLSFVRAEKIRKAR